MRKRMRKTGKVMQADFAEEGLIGLSHAAKGGDPEKNRGLKMPKEGIRKGKKPYKGKWDHQTGTNKNKPTVYLSVF